MLSIIIVIKLLITVRTEGGLLSGARDTHIRWRARVDQIVTASNCNGKRNQQAGH